MSWQFVLFPFIKPKRQPSWWRAFLLSMVVAIAIAACNPNSSAPDQNNKSFISDNVNSSELSHTVNHALGTTKVPSNPNRIVTLSFDTAESLLAMEIQPLGVIQPINPHLKKKLQEAKKVGWPPNLEKVLKLQPDLILGNTYYEDIYNQLSDIAPTVLAEYGGSDSWQAIHRKVGEAVNQTEKAEQVLADYRSRLETLREKLGDRAETIEISVVRIFPDRVNLVTAGSFVGSILEDAQLSRPASQQGDGVYRTISQEQLQLADGDVLFVWSHANTPENRREAQARIGQLESDPLWSKLEVVREGKVYPVGSHWIGLGPIAANLVIDDLFHYLVEEESS